MPHKYSFDSQDEQEPLGSQAAHHSSPSHRTQRQEAYYDEPAQSSPPRSRHRGGPAAHPDSSYGALAAGRQYPQLQPHAADRDAVSPVSPPRPPPHREFSGPQGAATGQIPLSHITPGADNFSEAAAGGMAGIAYSVADRNARESGVEAMRATQASQRSPPPAYAQQPYHGGYWQQQEEDEWQQQRNQPYGRAYGDDYQQMHDAPQRPRPSAAMGVVTGAAAGAAFNNVHRDSGSSLQGLNAAAIPPAVSSPGFRAPSRSPNRFANDVYTDDPYLSYSMHQDPHLGVLNPNDIEDDGDDGLVYGRGRSGARNSMLSLGDNSARSSRSGGHGHKKAAAVGAAAAGTAAAGGAVAAAAIGRSGGASRVAEGARYNAVSNGANTAYTGGGGSGGYGNDAYDLGRGPEKSEWLSHQGSKSKRWKWVILVGIAALIIAGIVLGIVFGVVLKKNNGSSNGGGKSGQSASGDTSANGDLDINSSEIQKLLNNKDLHKIFPGVDYTPIHSQYPDCLKNPPSQNNVTRDVAVLSQLTNTIRLYGTDCNQTEMTIHAIKQLKMEDTVKIWLGVWQDANKTTNARQLDQMWTILDTYGASPFVGVIVANEILFREQMTITELGNLLSSVRTNMTSHNINLPVATSDLGDKWTPELAKVSDYVMANIHPFFGGVNAKDSAAWTYSFWDNNVGASFKTDTKKNIISETGWPTTGGTDCGSDSKETVCPDAAVAGIDELNRFMEDWVCPALANGTEYFWFEAFDEPWKIMFDSGAQNWEDHWGLMDVNRNLKPGVKIPDCGGKTV